MNKKTLDYLLSVDDATALDFPPGFDYEEEIKGVEEIQRKLKAELGFDLEMEDGYSFQDSSILAELSINDPPVTELCEHCGAMTKKVAYVALAITFSNFGRLATIWGNSSRNPLEPILVRKIAAILMRSGYYYVSIADLEEIYTGDHSGYLSENCNWLHRYFDWY